MLSDAQIRELPTRQFAEKTHTSLGSTDSWGINRSNEAIGGYYGIAWYEAFEDGQGVRYKVYCWDGINGGKLPYRQEAEETS